MTSSAWSRDEVEAIVADDFAMLRAELSREPEKLIEQLPDSS